jgi:hypothetical protein
MSSPYGCVGEWNVSMDVILIFFDGQYFSILKFNAYVNICFAKIIFFLFLDEESFVERYFQYCFFPFLNLYIQYFLFYLCK